MTLPINFPKYFYASVIIHCEKLTDHKWLTQRWSVIGATTSASLQSKETRIIHQTEKETQYLLQGFIMSLYPDEAEGYYCNIRGEKPALYVVCHKHGDDEAPEPFLVTASYDEAADYLEGDEEIFSVDMPPEAYRWVETYVLEYYVPEKIKKRKRKNWDENKRV